MDVASVVTMTTLSMLSEGRVVSLLLGFPSTQLGLPTPGKHAGHHQSRPGVSGWLRRNVPPAFIPAHYTRQVVLRMAGSGGGAPSPPWMLCLGQ